MAKDPAFLFYYKDFDSDTADWEADTVGWYLRLLIFQAGNGYVPEELEELAQVSRVKFSEYEKFCDRWALRLAMKFETLSDGKLYNVKLSKVQAERKQGAIKKSVLAVFGNYIKQSDLTADAEKYIKSSFHRETYFYTILDAELRKSKILKFLKNIHEEYNERYAKRNATVKRSQQGNAIANAIVKENINKEKGGVGEKEGGFPELELSLLKSQIENEFSWKETVTRNMREVDSSFSLIIFEGYLEQFIKTLENDDDTCKTLKDFKKHFSRWLKIEIIKKNKNGNKTDNTNQDISKRANSAVDKYYSSGG
tara:strand:+ start:11456 stop:12385 length:930 start_codon:yes stop_codon:yes gene_type:complete